IARCDRSIILHDVPGQLLSTAYAAWAGASSRSLRARNTRVSIRAATRAGYPLTLAQQQVSCAAQQISARMVRLGSNHDLASDALMSASTNYGHAPPSVEDRGVPGRDICSQQIAAYSISSSAPAVSPSGTSRPSALAVCRLMTNSNLLDCTTG